MGFRGFGSSNSYLIFVVFGLNKAFTADRKKPRLLKSGVRPWNDISEQNLQKKVYEKQLGCGGKSKDKLCLFRVLDYRKLNLLACPREGNKGKGYYGNAKKF